MEYDERKSTGSHYTPTEIAEFIAEHIWSHTEIPSTKELNVLDPACGDGQLLHTIAETAPRDVAPRLNLYGVDQSSEAVESANSTLSKLNCSVQLLQGDFLDMCIEEARGPDLFNNGGSLPKPDIVIANPPYVRTQVMGADRSQVLSELFDLSGRVDLYQAFLVGITEKLRSGGILGIITSNRFLSIESGTPTRRLIRNNYKIKDIFDLGDTKLFDASVLPAIFIGEKNTSSDIQPDENSTFSRIYETDKQADREDKYSSVLGLLNERENGVYTVSGKNYEVSSGYLNIPTSDDEPWKLINYKESQWLDQIDSNSAFRFEDLSEIRVGIKTTADSVFIQDDWESLPKNKQPEEKLLRTIITSKDVDGWSINLNEERKVLYTHIKENGERRSINLNEYPRAKRYLESHKDRLAGRSYVMEASGRDWFEVWVPQNPDKWKEPKLVFPDISSSAQFAYNSGGPIVKGSCYWITLKEEYPKDVLFLLQGVANSSLISQYHDLAFRNRLYSGKGRHMTQYVEKYPVPDPDRDISKKISSLSQLVNKTENRTERDKITREIDEAVLEAFGVSLLE